MAWFLWLCPECWSDDTWNGNGTWWWEHCRMQTMDQRCCVVYENIYESAHQKKFTKSRMLCLWKYLRGCSPKSSVLAVCSVVYAIAHRHNFTPFTFLTNRYILRSCHLSRKPFALYAGKSPIERHWNFQFGRNLFNRLMSDFKVLKHLCKTRILSEYLLIFLWMNKSQIDLWVNKSQIFLLMNKS